MRPCTRFSSASSNSREEDRLLLEERLARLAEEEWKREAENARQIARERGLDQSAIDQAVHDTRYPS